MRIMNCERIGFNLELEINYDFLNLKRMLAKNKGKIRVFNNHFIRKWDLRSLPFKDFSFLNP